MIRRHGNPVWLGLFVVLALSLLVAQARPQAPAPEQA